MAIDEYPLAAQELLRRLARLPDQAGVLARPSETGAFTHVYDPLANEWMLLPTGDLPAAVRRLARRGDDRQECDPTIMVDTKGGVTMTTQAGLPAGYENKDLGSPYGRADRLSYGAPVRIPERKTDADVDQLLRQARERLAAREAAGNSSETEEFTTTGDDVPQEGEAPGEDEVAVMEAPEETVLPQTKRAVALSLLCAEECLPPPGPPPNLKVRYHVKHDPSVARIYGEIKGSPPAVFPIGRGEVGGYWRHRPSEVWVDVGLDPYRLVKAVLHEVTHSWRFRAGAGAMTEQAQEAEAWAWAEKLAPIVIEAADAEGGVV